MQLPSNKVGLVLIFVVLSVASTIFFTKIKLPEKLVDLENVDLLVRRNTDNNTKSGDADADGLLDWQEELYGSDPDNADTDGDGTNDGDEVSLRRDPTVPAPNDPLLTTKDLFNTNVNLDGYATGTVTDKLSVKLFSEYFTLKRNDKLNDETQEDLVNKLATDAVKNSDFKDYFVKSDLTIISSSKDTVKIYGTEFAQISITSILRMDSYKNLSEKQYMTNIANEYQNLAQNLAYINVPDVAGDAHLKIVNQAYQAGTLIKGMLDVDADPVEVTLAIAQYQASLNADSGLYTTLGQYFETNGIIFDDAKVINFWNYFK